ncbi:PAS domain S-box protein [Pseudoblastomonas halimionae]|uniref:Sensory/regulatory protein RpfC n=1 Tax=Alteriqipengyuania halimionae TaxID=1926630 RepID=A0A6I4U2T9_9SPHN|nr:PAS domain S-box protein [Alteriqipengyuania halimionae]MXP10389.1 PAS domain S-box protein [Alteriqipengyuania halimionae]
MSGSAYFRENGVRGSRRPSGLLAKLPVRILGLALGYAVLGWAGQQLAPPPGFASLIWPAAGLAIAAIAAWGYRVWPGVFLGAFLVNALAVSSVVFPPDATVLLNATVIATGSTLQAVLGGYWIRSRAGFPLKLAGPSETMRLVLLVAPLTCLVGATFGTSALFATGVVAQSSLLSFWLHWWAGDTGGVLLIVPLLLLAPWNHGTVRWRGEAISPFSTLAFIAILILLCATLAAWRLNMQAAFERSQASFESLATDSEQALDHRLQSYRQALDGGAALFEVSDGVTLGKWQVYTSVLDLAQTLPGISGIGFIEPVRAGDEPAFLESLAARGLDDFDIRPLTDRGEKFVIVAIEPKADNLAAVGLDIAFEENRRNAASNARDTGRATITKRILLVQDETESPGFLLLRPFYKAGMPTTTVEERRAAFEGWIYAPFIGPRFMTGLTPSQGELFEISVYDGARPDPDNLIFSSSEAGGGQASPDFTVERTFKVMEQTWTVVWTSTPAFERGMVTSAANLILVSGLMLTIIFAALLLGGSRREAYVRTQVDQRTRELEETVAALGESERRFGDLAGLSPAGIFRTDPYGFCTYVNEAWLGETGLSASQAMGAGWLDAVHPDHRQAVKQEWLAIVAAEKRWRSELQFVNSDGTPRWIDLIAAPRIASDGEMQGFIGVAIDVTEQKLAVDALKESEKRFQSLASSSPAGIFRTDADGVLNYVNPAWSLMAGLPEQEALGAGWSKAVYPDDLDGLAQAWAAAVEKGEPFRGEFRWLHQDGSIVWCDAVAQPVSDDEGIVSGYIGVVIDVSDRKRFEKEIAERDNQLALLAENATDAVFRVALDGTCLYASPSAQDVLGAPSENLIGTNALDGLHPDDEERVASLFDKLRSGRIEQIVVAYRWRLTDEEEYRWLEANAGLVKEDESDAAKEVSVSIRDIGDRKKMELDLVAARQTAETAAAAKATFLANMSHEIRTPMNGVVGFTELLLAGELSPDQREKAQLIGESGRAMMQILNDILDISKIDAGQMKIVREPIDLRHKLNSAIKLLEPSALQKGLDFELVVADDVPSRVMADPLRLRQILTNLVGNAIKFTSDGMVRCRVSVEPGLNDQDTLCIAVEDSGIGIPADRLEAIFREFSQADESTARIFGGTGLGLTISNELAKMMDGELVVSSEQGHGSVFTLRLPLLRAEATQVALDTELSGERELAFARPPRILVAEDHDINQALILSMASRIGLAFDIAANGEETVRIVTDAREAGKPYDLVLMDVQMPIMDGLEATRSLREAGISGKEMPILAQTANAYSDDVERCLAAGMQGHLAKPIRMRSLKAAIKEWLPEEIFSDSNATSAKITPPDPGEALAKRYAERRDKTLDALHGLDATSAIDRGEVEAVAMMLHQLAGSAGMFGEAELGEAARAQQKAMLEAEGDAISDAVRKAQQAFSALR